MNLEKNPQKEELIELIKPCDDNNYAHIIYVTKTGLVKIHPVHQNESPSVWAEDNKELLQFRLETCVAGNGYTGADAAKDKVWINRLFTALTENWSQKNIGYVDNF